MLLTCWNAHPGGFFVNGGNKVDTLYEGNRAPLVTEFLTLNRQYNREQWLKPTHLGLWSHVRHVYGHGRASVVTTAVVRAK